MPLSSTDTSRGDSYFDLSGIVVIGVVNQLSNQLDAFGIESLADGNQMAFVDGYREVIARFHREIQKSAFSLGRWHDP